MDWQIQKRIQAVQWLIFKMLLYKDYKIFLIIQMMTNKFQAQFHWQMLKHTPLSG